MAKSKKDGLLYEIEGRSIKLFGLQGVPMGKNWAMGINFGSGADGYMLVEVDPAPAGTDVRNVILQDQADGNFDNIAHVAMSSRVAVRLFLEGVLQTADFKGAEELTVDVSQFVNGGQPSDAIRLPSVNFGQGFTFPVLIMSEFNVGAGTIVTLDKDGQIV